MDVASCRMTGYINFARKCFTGKLVVQFTCMILHYKTSVTLQRMKILLIFSQYLIEQTKPLFSKHD